MGRLQLSETYQSLCFRRTSHASYYLVGIRCTLLKQNLIRGTATFRYTVTGLFSSDIKYYIGVNIQWAGIGAIHDESA